MAVLELADVQKTFRTPEGGEHLVLDVPAYRLGEAEQAALEGSSGSGKTTLLNVIAGILAADTGKVLVGGADMRVLSEAERDRNRARHVGYVFQTFNLLQGYTALENVELAMLFGKGVDGGFARSLLERVGLGDRMHYRPRQLSVGQQQRVAVARALANRPALVLADEPTGNLDEANARDVLALIRSLCEENRAALLLVSHDRATLDSFPRLESLRAINRAAAPAAVPAGKESAS